MNNRIDVPRSEYPRPHFRRDRWQNVNGTWSFTFDDADRGLVERWFEPQAAGAADPFTERITVPFPYQSELSGIGLRSLHDVLWYRRRFSVPLSWRGQRVLLHFGAVDYRAWVWLNGEPVAFHEGGHTPFHVDVTDVLSADGVENGLVVRVEDISGDLTQPRGKQFWKERPEGIYYTGSSGIWQTVWLEPVARLHLEGVQFTPNVKDSSVTIDCRASREQRAEVRAEISLEDRLVTTATIALDGGRGVGTVVLPDAQLWSPEQPTLYDVKLELVQDGVVQDVAQSYFGMREIAVVDGRIELNGKPYLMRLVLDQGYYPDGLLAAPSDEAIRRDVELAKAMGFNGVRKHQKVEDPRYLYWADRLGLLVWGEMANCYRFSERAMQRLYAEWQAVIERDYNHPCIVAWVPVNESWGVPQLRNEPRQAHFLLSLYHQTKALDATRLVIANDGWEHVVGDLVTVHDYTADSAQLQQRYSSLEQALAFNPSGRPLYTPGFAHRGEPIIISECGGIAFRLDGAQGWGYTTADDASTFERGYQRLLQGLLAAPLVQGFCYTQFTDVEQEINGLLTFDRQPKLPLERIRAITQGDGAHANGQRQAEEGNGENGLEQQERPALVALEEA